jgi:DNA-binding transcriptional MerR regulator
MRYTVKQLGTLAGVTPRTLHYYDEIGLLHPAAYGDNGYRYYGDEAVLRLQQILFFRELNFSLEQIKPLIDRPDFDLLHALQAHRKALLEEVERLTTLINTIDKTMQHLRGEIHMDKKDFYTGFDEEKQKKYAEEAERRWGTPAAQSQKSWEKLTANQKNDILAQMNEITVSISANMDKGAGSAEVQHWVGRWHQHINQHFYPCSLEIFESLGHMYNQDPDFKATYEKVRPGMAAFMEEAMVIYCKGK